MNLLLVVDMQNDFVYGSLGSDQAIKIVPRVKEYIEKWKKENDGVVVFTKDMHLEHEHPASFEEIFYPEHCLIDSRGSEIVSELSSCVPRFEITKSTPLIEPDKLEECLNGEEPDTIDIVGLCTDICVITNALFLRSKYKHAIINIIVDCCAGTSESSHEAALEVMGVNGIVRVL